MKEKLVLIAFIACVGWAGFTFAKRAADVTVGVDYIQRDFGELGNVLPPGANISVASIDIDSAGFVSTFFLFRYVMVPRYVSLNAAECDTVLTFFGRFPTLAGYHSVVDGRRILWQKKGDNCLFVLTGKY